MNQARKKKKAKKQCFVFMADGKDCAVLLVKNVVNRMSQQRTYFQETILLTSVKATLLYGLGFLPQQRWRKYDTKDKKKATFFHLLKLLLTT